VNGKKEGNWISYYSSGRKKLSGDYMEGHRQGVFTEWYENGQKKSVINYSYDIVDGKMTVYYDTGAIFYEGNMNDKDGTVKGYDQNGTLRFEGKLEKGKKVGNWTYYDGMGNPIR
jgi:morn repeat-containing protein